MERLLGQLWSGCWISRTAVEWIPGKHFTGRGTAVGKILGQPWTDFSVGGTAVKWILRQLSSRSWDSFGVDNR